MNKLAKKNWIKTEEDIPNGMVIRAVITGDGDKFVEILKVVKRPHTVNNSLYKNVRKIDVVDASGWKDSFYVSDFLGYSASKSFKYSSKLLQKLKSITDIREFSAFISPFVPNYDYDDYDYYDYYDDNDYVEEE